jgi:hypothetical protein
MFGKTVLALALSAGMAAQAASPASAGIVASDADPGAGAPPLVQEAQIVIPIPGVGVLAAAPFFFGGHDYCWYDDAWNGPGWYWCGYGYRSGYGWGGGEGFHGWQGHRSEHDWHPHGGPGGHPGPVHPGPGPHHDEHHHP